MGRVARENAKRNSPHSAPFPRDFCIPGERRERGEGTELLLPGAEIDLGLFSKATNLANARATGAGDFAAAAGPIPGEAAQ